MSKTNETTCAVYRDFRVTIGCSPMVELFPCWTRKGADKAMDENGWQAVRKWRKTFLDDAEVCTVSRKPALKFRKWNKDGGYTLKP